MTLKRFKKLKMFEFREWPKIPRGQNEEITITEKIDGTNACVVIGDDGKFLGCQSRNKIITPNSDNMGFATWAEKNKIELEKLGPGYHYGEWAGPGIQQNKHKLETKKFFLFNSQRWSNNTDRPSCCDVVPVLFEGEYKYDVPQLIMGLLMNEAKKMNYEPEGIVIWFHKTRRYEKHTFKNQNGKWQEI